MKHDATFLDCPWHGLPPFLAFLNIFLWYSLIPRPQDLLHSPRDCHELQIQFILPTGAWKCNFINESHRREHGSVTPDKRFFGFALQALFFHWQSSLHQLFPFDNWWAEQGHFEHDTALCPPQFTFPVLNTLPQHSRSCLENLSPENEHFCECAGPARKVWQTMFAGGSQGQAVLVINSRNKLNQPHTRHYCGSRSSTDKLEHWTRLSPCNICIVDRL